MATIQPPYRLNTAEQVESFIGDSRRKSFKGMLKLARTKKLTQPPVLLRMPEKVSLKVYDVRREVRKIVEDVGLIYDLESATAILREAKENFLAAVKDAPESYFDMVAREVARMRKFLGGRAAKETPSMKIVPQKVIKLLDDKAELYVLLAGLLRRAINTKDETVREFLKEILILLLAYDMKTFHLDRKAVENLSALSDNSSLLLAELNRIFGKRLDSEKRKIFNASLYSYLDRSKNRASKVRCPAFFKQNVLVLMDEFADHKDVKRAKHKWKKLVDAYQGKISEGQLKKMKSLLDNFLSKIRQFDDFFNVTLRAGELKNIYKIYGRPTVKTVITEETIATGVELILYPCKDYHDFLKGYYSGDCTASGDLAARHLRNERFFNIRIFRWTEWIGNIYCLDYTDINNTLVIDRIQLAKSTKLIPLRFFPRFMDVILKELLPGGDVRILGPPRISNYGSVEGSYASYVLGKPMVKFKFRKGDKGFASAGRSNLYVLA